METDTTVADGMLHQVGDTPKLSKKFSQTHYESLYIDAVELNEKLQRTLASDAKTHIRLFAQVDKLPKKLNIINIITNISIVLEVLKELIALIGTLRKRTKPFPNVETE